jgi:Lrp/AsnC family transcriptional regulator, leucine-responsive regulatory protein
MFHHELDEIDMRILAFLLENFTRSYKEIGTLVHMTGQAVGLRVRRLQERRV